MKRLARAFAALSLIAFISGCAAAVQPVTGFVFSDVKGPVAATSAEKATKVGTAECQSILGWIATGDASIDAAMRNGGITKIHHVDHHSWSILGILAKFTVTVYGE